MEAALVSRKFQIREIAPVSFLNELIPKNVWNIEIDEKLQVVTVNGDPSDLVQWNSTLRSLVWVNHSAEDWNILSGALTFDREWIHCHGSVTSGEEKSYLVEMIRDEPLDSEYPTTEASLVSYFGFEKFGFEAPPAYAETKVSEIQVPDSKQSTDGIKEEQTAVDEEGLPEDAESNGGAAAAASDGAAAAEEAPQEPITSKIKLLTYSSKRQEQGDEEWGASSELGIGTEYGGGAHAVVTFDGIDISSFVRIDGDNFVKPDQKTGDECPYIFDITFSGSAENRTFKGTLQNLKGKPRIYNWEGKFSALTEIDRLGTNQKAKGTDGLLLDPLLHSITSMSSKMHIDEKTKQAVAVDLAQQEADRILGRLIFGSVDKEVSDLLFPGVFNLAPAELAIQKLGEEFLKRAGIHYVMANIKSSESVKPKTKNRIQLDKCNRFLPMCSALAEPVEGVDDPVILYGLDRKKPSDMALVKMLQEQASAVSRACYLLGYRTSVSLIHPYLKNAGEWYKLLQAAITGEVFLQDWANRSIGSEGYAKALYDMNTKLDVLWDTACEKDPKYKENNPDIMEPTEIISVLNAKGLEAMLDKVGWDDTSRANLRTVSGPLLNTSVSLANVIKFFKKLDESEKATEKDKRTAQMVANFRKQMIVDGAKPTSFITMGEFTLDLMEELGKAGERGAKSTAEYTRRMAALDGQQLLAARDAADPPPSWWKGIKWHEGALSYIRAAVTVVAMSGLIYMLTENAAHMDWQEQLVMFGQLAEGFQNVRVVMGKMAGAIATKVGSWASSAGSSIAQSSWGQWLSKFFSSYISKYCKIFGSWLWKNMNNIGGALIRGIGKLLTKIADLIAKGVEKVTGAFSKAGNWLKNLPIDYDGIFKVVAKGLSFGISAVCFWISIRACREAYKSGRTIDKVTSTIAAALAGLEVLSLVIQGICWMVGYEGAIVSFCVGAGPILAAAGIVFAIVIIIIAFACQEDPLDDLVVKYGQKYGIAGCIPRFCRHQRSPMVYGYDDFT